MSQPVWVLSVDLQTKTATFQSGMSDAVKTARSAFSEIKSGADGMGKEVGYSMFEARHSVMLLGEEFGVHLPRALTSFIASIGPVGAAMEAAFPFLAVAMGATLLIEHLQKIHEAGEKITESQANFVNTTAMAFNQLDQKMLQAEIRADDLSNDHLAKLNHEVELINKQSMADLVHAFDEVAKSAEGMFATVEHHWFDFGKGAEGAKASFKAFKVEYDGLALNDPAAATKLLDDRVARGSASWSCKSRRRRSPRVGTPQQMMRNTTRLRWRISSYKK